MKTSRRMTSAGGITLPKDLRLRLGWKPGMSLDIEDAGGGGIYISPHVKRCVLCGGTERTHTFGKVLICEHCAVKIKEEIL